MPLLAVLETLLSDPQTWRRVGAGATVLLVLEVSLPWLARRGLELRAVWHLWALSLALLVASWSLLAGPLALGLQMLVGGLTGLALFGILDAFLFARPRSVGEGPWLPRLARDVVRVAMVIAFILIASVGGPDHLKAVLVSSTVVSAVVGLALQDVLKNVFAGLALDLEKPFQRGDWLLLDGRLSVQVIDITWRSTWLRTNEGVDIYEPNATMNTSRLINHGQGARPVAFGFEVGLPYSLTPARARELLIAAARHSPLAESAPAPEALLDHFGESSVVYRLRVWTLQVGRMARFRDEVLGRIWYEVSRSGHSIPFPIRTVHLHQAEAEAETNHSEELEVAEKLLGGVSLFDGLGAEALSALVASARQEPWDVGEELVREGDGGDSLYVVVRGRLEVVRDREQQGIRLGELGPGDFFGESSLLTGEPRSATVRALTPAETLVLSHAALAPLLAADPTLVERLSAALAARRAQVAARREGGAESAPAHDREHESLLARVRSFFRLG